MTRTIAFLFLLTTFGVMTRATSAFDGDMPWFGFGSSGSLYGLGYLPVPPYFAVHPPVQYSGPVAYPYGYSPYAARAENRVVVQAPQPRLSMNPFASPESSAETPAPRIIINPYFKAKP